MRAISNPFASRAAEALEHQIRYWKMLESPAYRAYIQKRNSDNKRKGENGALVTNELMDRVSRVAMQAGEPFWWSPQICDLIQTVAPSMPDYTLTRERLPAAGGLFWFAKPIRTRTSTVHAIAWGQVLPEEGSVDEDGRYQAKAISARPQTLQDAVGVCAAFYEADSYYPSKDPVMRRWEIPMAVNTWGFEKSFTKQAEHNLAGIDGPEHDAMDETRIFAAAMFFLNQKIMVSPRQTPDRAALKRIHAEKSHHEASVRVVALRKAFERLSGADKQEGDPVEWSCHWLVGAERGGFWRNQWIPSEGRHELRFILPFFKGDFDKPFKPPSQLLNSVHR